MEKKDQFLCFMLEHQNTIKMLHFQTTSRNYHKDLDDYYTSFSNNMDVLIEYLSSSERFNIKKITLLLDIPDDIIEYLENQSFYLFDFLKDDEIFDDASKAIIQDMIVKLKRTIYLLKAN